MISLTLAKKLSYIDGHPVDFIINGYERKMRVEKEGDKLAINIDLSLEGQLNGYYVDKKILGKEELAKFAEILLITPLVKSVKKL